METTEQEIWKDVKGYEGIYQASNYGRIKSLKRKTMKQDYIVKGHLHKGYLHHTVKRKEDGKIKYQCRTLHRLVLLAWKDNPNNKPEINHINGIKTDNRPCNLEWVTGEENRQHAKDNGLIQKIGVGNPNNPRNKPVKQCDINDNLIKVHISAVVAAKEINGNNKSINNAMNRANNIYKGYKWYYA